MTKRKKISRSENMRRIRSKDTEPEIAVRRLCRELGFPGYRLHRKDIPGKPDLVWTGRKLAIFVHGCFWHGHDCKEGIRIPKSNQDYWIPKIQRNKERDKANILELQSKGWRIIIIWECEIKQTQIISRRISNFLASISGSTT